MFKAFLEESKENDREMVEQMVAREGEMQAAEHSLMCEFMGSLSLNYLKRTKELLRFDFFEFLFREKKCLH